MNRGEVDFHRYIAITAVIIVLVMTVLDVSVVNVALPVLSQEFSVDESVTVWVVTIYQLIIVMLLLPLSSVGDQYGYRRNFLTGVIVFTTGSALCSFSYSFAMLLISRAIQAIGAAGIMSVNVALTRTIYPRNILGRGLALNAMFISAATASGPGLAGWIMSVASWHWLFLINVPLGIIAYFIGRKVLPENPGLPENPHFDIKSGILNVIVFGLIFYSLGSIARKGDLGLAISLLVVAIVVGIFYIKSQSKAHHPILPVDLFKNRLYSMSIGTNVCSFIAQNIAMISLPFLFLTGLGFSELTTGLLMTPWPVATMIISPIAARIIEKHNPAFVAATGMLIYSAGVVLMIFLPSHVGISDVWWRMALCGMGFGFFQTPNNIVMVMATPVERTGAAGGMQSTARLTGQTFGSTIVTIVFSFVIAVAGAVRISLYIALGFAIIALVFSLFRGQRIIHDNTHL